MDVLHGGKLITPHLPLPFRSIPHTTHLTRESLCLARRFVNGQHLLLLSQTHDFPMLFIQCGPRRYVLHLTHHPCVLYMSVVKTMTIFFLVLCDVMQVCGGRSGVVFKQGSRESKKGELV